MGTQINGQPVKPIRRFSVRLADKDTSLVTGALGGDFRISDQPITIIEVGAYVDTAGTTGTMTIDIHDAGTTIMDTNKITIDTGEESSETAATPPAITDTAGAADVIYTAIIDAVHTTAAKGLTLWVRYTE